jgi:hypothetical protein
MLKAPTTPARSPIATDSAGKQPPRPISSTVAWQREVGLDQLGCAGRLVGKAAQHGRIQCTDPQRRAQARHQAIIIAAAQRQRQGILRQLALGLDRD